MKSSILYISLAFLAFAFQSCEKVIDIDLNSSNPVLSVDAKLFEGSAAQVQLNYSTDYFYNEESSHAENAKVIITSSTGESEELTHSGAGLYIGENLIGEVDKSYSISIEDDDELYEANSDIIAPVEIYNVTFEKLDFGHPGPNNNNNNKDRYMPTFKFSDDPSITNYYLLRFWKNDTLMEGNYTTLEDTYYTKNDTIEFPGFRNNFELSDKLTVKIFTISKEEEIYFNQLNDNMGGGMMGSSTPYNPKSNFGPEVMGYFMAMSYDEYTIVVTE